MYEFCKLRQVVTLPKVYTAGYPYDDFVRPIELPHIGSFQTFRLKNFHSSKKFRGSSNVNIYVF